jgi:DNA-binding Lrp family transcriptional regulator
MFNMVAHDARAFALARDEVLGRVATGIREMESAVFTEMVYFNRKYLGAPPRAWTALTNSTQIEFDESFRRVLRRMCIDARASEVSIAKAEQLTPIVVRTRREQAEASGVIIGYRARLDRGAFDLSSYKLHLQLRNHAPESIAALRRFAHRHPHVSQFMLHIGGWPCEMNIEAHDNRHAAQVIDELRDQHGDLLGLIDISLYDRDTFSWGFGIYKISDHALRGGGDSLASAV